MLFHPSYHCASQTASWGTCDTRQIDGRGKVALEREEEGRGSNKERGTRSMYIQYLTYDLLRKVRYVCTPTFSYVHTVPKINSCFRSRVSRRGGNLSCLSFVQYLPLYLFTYTIVYTLSTTPLLLSHPISSTIVETNFVARFDQERYYFNFIRE